MASGEVAVVSYLDLLGRGCLLLSEGLMPMAVLRVLFPKVLWRLLFRWNAHGYYALRRTTKV